MRKGIPKGRANILKTTRDKSNVDIGWERRLRKAEQS